MWGTLQTIFYLEYPGICLPYVAGGIFQIANIVQQLNIVTINTKCQAVNLELKTMIVNKI